MGMTGHRHLLSEPATVAESAAESPLEWGRAALARVVPDNGYRQPLDARVGASASSTSAGLAPPAPDGQPFPGQPPQDGSQRPPDLGTLPDKQRAIRVSTLSIAPMHDTFQGSMNRTYSKCSM